MVLQLDNGLVHLGALIRKYYGIDLNRISGTGAAGGSGAAFVTFLGATLKPGIELILDASGLDHHLTGADLVITGEGKLDRQTGRGKAPAGILHAAQRRHVPVIAIGGIAEDRELLNQMGFDAVFPVAGLPTGLADAIRPEVARRNIRLTVIQIMNTIRLAQQAR